MAVDLKVFHVGDKVSWTSQSAGYRRTKMGTVEAVVPVKGLPDRERFVQLWRGAGVGLPRDHVSYVVRVAGKTEKSAGKLYWPRVSALNEVEVTHENR